MPQITREVLCAKGSTTQCFGHAGLCSGHVYLMQISGYTFCLFLKSFINGD